MADNAPEVDTDTFINEVPAYKGATIRRTVIGEELFLEGIVVSIPDNRNLAPSFQRHYFHSSSTPTLIAAYLQSEDGTYGLRLDFQKRDMNTALKQFHRAKISLKGLTLCREGAGYVISGLTPENVVEVSEDKCYDPASKTKTIAELTDNDIYTYVCLKDCEFVFKDGAMLNVYEKYSKSPGPGAEVGLTPNSMMDTWATPLTDKAGGECYMIMSTALTWRRSGVVPQGTGTVQGIIDRPSMPRYGDIHLSYGIHPLVRKDIGIQDKGEGAFTTIAEWNWNDGGTDLRLKDGRILADAGFGLLSTDVPGAKLGRSNDFNNPVMYPEKEKDTDGTIGRKERGALRISATGSAWWNWAEDHGNALIAQVSTKGLSGHNLLLAFSFAGGGQYAKTSSWFPCYWCVEYSVDGRRFYKVQEPDIVLRSLPWGSSEKNLEEDTYGTSEEAGLGMTEHLVRLPMFLLGRDMVIIRITPSRKVVSSLAWRDQAKGALTPTLQGKTLVHFGAVKLMYN